MDMQQKTHYCSEDLVFDHLENYIEKSAALPNITSGHKITNKEYQQMDNNCNQEDEFFSDKNRNINSVTVVEQQKALLSRPDCLYSKNGTKINTWENSETCGDEEDCEYTMDINSSLDTPNGNERKRIIAQLGGQLDKVSLTGKNQNVPVLEREIPQDEQLANEKFQALGQKKMNEPVMRMPFPSKGPVSNNRPLVNNCQRVDGIKSPISPSFPFAAARPGHRRLPPLPTVSAANKKLLPNEDHRLCFGMDSILASQIKCTSQKCDANIASQSSSYYYELDGLNGNTNMAFSFQQEDSSDRSTVSEHLSATHRAQSVFIPRHDDEALLEVGDPVHVYRDCEDHWSYGINLRTGQTGIFPTVHIFEIDIVEELCGPDNTPMKSDDRDTFYLTMLGSIEVAHHKGNDVLVQAINKILFMYQNKEDIIVPHSVLFDISFRGVHIIDKRKKNWFRCPIFDYFFSLQNISFCGAHPKQLKYFGFITKHPLLPRFACHVFMSNESTQPIVEGIGRAFKRSYDEYMAFAHPTEDIYLE